MNHDDDMDRFRDEPANPAVAGDDLARLARQMHELRDYLLGLCRDPRAVSAQWATLMEVVEEGVTDLLAPEWNACQEVLEGASDDDLAETDTEWMGEPLPLSFESATPESVRALYERLRKPRVPTNPATLLAMGAARE